MSTYKDCRPTKFEMQFLGILHRIIKSTMFNIFMLILGFCIGFGYVTLRIHYHAVTNANYEFVEKIEKNIEELAEMDKQYTVIQHEVLDQLKLFKIKISHDTYNVDNIFRLNSGINIIQSVDNVR